MLLLAFFASLTAGVVLSLGPCGLGLHRKPGFVSKRNAGWECLRCRRVQFNHRRK